MSLVSDLAYRGATAVAIVSLVTACAPPPQLHPLGPESGAEPSAVIAEHRPRMIRLALHDGRTVALYSPRLHGDSLLGVRDAGPPTGVPLDSIAYVDAYLPNAKGVSVGEVLRLATFVGAVALVGACIVDLCPASIGQ